MTLSLKCIYCNGSGELTKEHVIPHGLGGNIVLPQASCLQCCKITSGFEEKCCRNLFGATRQVLNIKQRKGHRPQSFALPAVKSMGKVLYSKENYPAALFIPFVDFPLPHALADVSTDEPFVCKLSIRNINVRPEANHQNVNLLQKSFDMQDWGRMLAKIAHSYLIKELGRNQFEPFLNDFISDGSKKGLGTFIGGQTCKSIGTQRHEISHTLHTTPGGRELFLVKIRLFAEYESPEHFVVVGEKLGKNES